MESREHDRTKMPRTCDFVQPERCAWCFNLRGIAISSITIILVVAILLFVLDFTVLEVHRRQKNYYEKKFEMFQVGGQLEVQPTFENAFYLKTIDLSQVEVNVSVLYQLMTYGFRIETIRFRNLKFSGKLPNALKDFAVSRPNLKEFLLELDQPIGPTDNFQIDDCDECIVEGQNSSFLEIRRLQCLPPLLFYINAKALQPLQQLESLRLTMLTMKTNVTVNIYGRNLLRVTHENSSTGAGSDVTTMFSDCEPIVKSYMFNVKKLAISGCTLSTSTLAVIIRVGKLTHLSLDQVHLTGFTDGQRLSQLFKNALSLEYLTLKMSWFTKNESSMTSPSYSVLMTDFPNSLKTLVLMGVSIIAPVSDTSKNYLTLDTLRLSDIIFESQRAFDLFPNGIDFKKLAFRQMKVQTGEKIGNILEESTIWISFLNNVMGKASWIWFENPFHRPSKFWMEKYLDRNPANVQILIRGIEVELKAWKTWLRKKGIDEQVLNDDPAFTLIKSNSRGQGSWDMESSHDGSPPNTPNAATWFHFLRMGTFLRENLWSVVDW